jgi:Predicted acyltransferases
MQLFSYQPSKTVKQPVLRKTSKFDINLEALRGFAAIFVVINHVIILERLRPGFSPNITKFQTPAHLSVIIFFVLSGYVIGLTNQNRLSGPAILSYLKKRFIRLYPIYFLSITFALLIASTIYPLSTIIGNYTFTQVLVTKVIGEIIPVWSLNYEVLYYLLFIGISFFSFNPIKVLMTSLLIGIGNYFLYPYTNTPLITSYAFGFAFWTTGLVIAKYFLKSNAKPDYTKLVGLIFLILSLNTFNVLSTGFIKFSTFIFGHIPEFPETVDPLKRIITFMDLSFLPYCFLLVLAFSEKSFRFKKQIFAILQLLPALTFAYMILNRNKYDASLYLLHSIYYLISLGFFYLKERRINFISKKVIRGGSWLGSISYGIYIIHFPILVLLNRMYNYFGLENFILRFLILITLVLFVSYLLEKKMQPLFKKLLERTFSNKSKMQLEYR